MNKKESKQFVYICMHVYMKVPLPVYTHTWSPGVDIQCSSVSPPYILKQGLSLNLELNCFTEISQQTSGVWLSLSP